MESSPLHTEKTVLSLVLFLALRKLVVKFLSLTILFDRLEVRSGVEIVLYNTEEECMEFTVQAYLYQLNTSLLVETLFFSYLL